MSKKIVFWFRRDLRVKDNTGLFNAVKDGYEVLPIFIFSEKILGYCPSKDQRIGFLIDCLIRLDNELKKLGSHLIVLKGDRKDEITNFALKNNVNAIYSNKSFSLNTEKLDKKVGVFCSKNKIIFKQFQDNLLVDPEKVETRKVFTPFYKKWKNHLEDNYNILEINKINTSKIEYKPLSEIIKNIDYSQSIWKPEQVFKNLDEFNYENYENTRNIPSVEGTSKLSPYTRFGILSIRETFNKVLEKNEYYDVEVFIKELAWREFWYHIMLNFPNTRKVEFQEKRRNIKWLNNKEHFEAWKDGKTGYPLIDAGMIQLKEEGWIHNRVRMVVASFLTKDLIIDWRWGEEHFAKYLIDYDQNVNIGNWQWSASVGADPKPLRIFSPILQSKRFDPDAIYIKKYIPELKYEPLKSIHDPLKYSLKYINPIIDHYEMSKLAKELFRKSKEFIID